MCVDSSKAAFLKMGSYYFFRGEETGPRGNRWNPVGGPMPPTENFFKVPSKPKPTSTRPRRTPDVQSDLTIREPKASGEHGGFGILRRVTIRFADKTHAPKIEFWCILPFSGPASPCKSRPLFLVEKTHHYVSR
jgi:hypothetical protein